MRHEPLAEFMGRFVFDPANAWKVGVERELFIKDRASGLVVPRAPQLLSAIWKRHPRLAQSFGYELSACQLETRTPPVGLEALMASLQERERVIAEVLADFGCIPEYDGVGPETMSVQTYPDSRYDRIVSNNPPTRILAACRIIGTHGHIGMKDAESALRVYNHVVQNLHSLRMTADKTDGARRAIYREVVADPTPVIFRSWADFHAHAIEHGYAENPRDNWAEVRITRYGTIEFRLFDGTSSTWQIVSWLRECSALCRAGSF